MRELDHEDLDRLDLLLDRWELDEGDWREVFRLVVSQLRDLRRWQDDHRRYPKWSE